MPSTSEMLKDIRRRLAVWLLPKPAGWKTSGGQLVLRWCWHVQEWPKFYGEAKAHIPEPWRQILDGSEMISCFPHKYILALRPEMADLGALHLAHVENAVTEILGLPTTCFARWDGHTPIEPWVEAELAAPVAPGLH